MSHISSAIRSKIVVIAGPTGIGKTAAALSLGQTFQAEIVNADSMQVYRRLDIGTAKPTLEERARVVHHLIDIVEPDQDFNAAQYLNLARPLIRDLDSRGTRVLAVGGTGLYLRSLLYGLFEGPGQNPELRARLKEEARVSGRQALHGRLTALDPEAAARIHPNDLFRVVRALEVFELTGRPISDFQAAHRLAERPYELLFFALNLPREELYERIEARAKDMFDRGLVEEVDGLLARGYSSELKPFRSIGYKQVVDYLQGRLTLKQAGEEVIKQTRRLAKRQLTWFRSQPEVVWVSPEDLPRLEREIGRFWD